LATAVLLLAKSVAQTCSSDLDSHRQQHPHPQRKRPLSLRQAARKLAGLRREPMLRVLLLTTLLIACSPAADPCAGTGSYSLGHAPKLAVADDSGHVWTSGEAWTAPAGTQLHLDLRNAGQGVDGAPLRIASIDVQGPLTCALADGKPCAGAVIPALLGSGGVATCVAAGGVAHLTLQLTAGGNAQLLVKTTDPPATWTLQVGQPAGRGQLVCPATLALPDAASGTTASVSCHNLGDGPLRVSGAKVSGTYAEWYAVQLAGQPIAQPLPSPLQVEPGSTLEVQAVVVKLPEQHTTTAYLQIASDDPQHPQVEVALVATLPGDCLLLKPSQIDFAAIPVGAVEERGVELRNCSGQDVPQTSVTIPGGQALDFKLVCSPAHLGVVDGILHITSEGGALQVPLHCGTTASTCPTACLTPLAQSVPVHQAIALDSTCSQATAGHILKGRVWTVTDPKGVQVQVSPSATAPQVSFTPHQTGTWTVQLDVTDDAGTPGCTPAVMQVQVIPDDALHADLTWDQPGLPVGAAPPSVELHLAELSTGAELPDTTQDGEPDPWFQPCLDVWKVNAQPNWGLPDSDLDDPVLMEGTGGSSIRLYAPAVGLYAFAVYVWTDQKHGPVTPHVHLHAKGLPDQDVMGPPLVTGDLWCVQRIQWNQAGLPQWSACPGQALAHKFPPPSPSQSFGCK
jgi:hypothetical protein